MMKRMFATVPSCSMSLRLPTLTYALHWLGIRLWTWYTSLVYKNHSEIDAAFVEGIVMQPVDPNLPKQMTTQGRRAR